MLGAEIIVVGGDVRAVQTFAGRPPKRWQDRLVQTDAGAELVLVEPEDVRLEHGIGGVLRYADASTAAS